MKYSRTFQFSAVLRSLFLLLLLSILTMCSHPDYVLINNQDASKTNDHDKSKLMKVFGRALVKVLSDEKEARDLIKNEALKRFDYDYDVLYHMIKDTPIHNEFTFRDLIVTAMKEQNGDNRLDKARVLLSQIESEVPLLTIMVPELPENSFSAKIWNTSSEKPLVGLRIYDKEGVPLLSADGNETHLPYGSIPGFPVVVVKENERVIVSTKLSELSFSVPNSTFKYEFVSKYVNNLTKSHNASARFIYYLDQKVIDAFNIMSPSQGWQRDYIYYNLTPTNTQGTRDAGFEESVTSFRFVQSGQQAYESITTQGSVQDPKIKTPYGSSAYNEQPQPPTGSAAWTEGHFDFAFNVTVNSIGGIAPPRQVFPVEGEQLFNIEYELAFWDSCRWYHGCFGNDFAIYHVKSITNKEYQPTTPIGLFRWNLGLIAPEIYVEIEEVDNPEVIKNETSTTAEFAVNFTLPFGDVKDGNKFGFSGKQSRTSIRSSTVSVAGNGLGSRGIEFGDNVVEEAVLPYPNGPVATYRTKEYLTPYVAFSFEPTRIP